MKRKAFVGAFAVIMALGVFAGGAWADGAALSGSILNPKVPPQASDDSASQAPKKIAKKNAKKAGKPKAARLVLYAKGSIVGIRAVDSIKKQGERIVVAVGKKLIEIAVEPGTVIKSAKGRIVAAASLKKGERIKVVYETRGAKVRADSIDIL